MTVDLTFKREFSYYLLTIYVPCCMLVIVSWVTSIYSILQNLHCYHPSTSFCNDEPIGQRVFICYRTLHHYSHCSMWESCQPVTFFISYPTQLLDGAQKHYCCFINKKRIFFFFYLSRYLLQKRLVVMWEIHFDCFLKPSTHTRSFTVVI